MYDELSDDILRELALTQLLRLPPESRAAILGAVSTQDDNPPE